MDSKIAAILAAGANSHMVTTDGGHTAAFTFYGTRVLLPCTVPANSIFLLPSGTLAASGTDYWSIVLGVYRAGSDTPIVTVTTDVTGLTANTVRTTTHAAFNLLPGDIMVAAVSVGAGSPSALPICSYYFPSPAT